MNGVSGEMFRLVKSINRRRGDKIVEVRKVFILPDGARAGKVGLMGSWFKEVEFPRIRDAFFKGKRLIDRVRGEDRFHPHGQLYAGWRTIIQCPPRGRF